jgi:hypothetical protein
MIPSTLQVDELHRNWIWVHDWQDSSSDNTSGRLVTFTRALPLQSVPPTAIIHCTADTRYKLLVNGARVAVGPSRSSPERWLYDTIDIAPFLKQGDNVITVIVLRYFYATRAAMPFVRTGYPGLTLIGSAGATDLRTGLHDQWSASVDNGTLFPMDLEDDVFLHVGVHNECADCRSMSVSRDHRRPQLLSSRTSSAWSTASFPLGVFTRVSYPFLSKLPSQSTKSTH